MLKEGGDHVAQPQTVVVYGVPAPTAVQPPGSYPPSQNAPQAVYIPPPGAYPVQQAVYPPGAGPVVMAPQAVYVQQMQRTPGFYEGVCTCGGDLGAAHWTIIAWLLCIFFCPFNFCYPCCMPESRYCQRCGKEYYKPE